MRALAISLACLISTAFSHRHHGHSKRGSLLSALGGWAHPEGHPVADLFKRAPGDYPNGVPDANAMPQAWKDALAALTAAGRIPDIPQTKDGIYPPGVHAAGPAICASALQCQGDGDIWDAPDGMIGISFDDGPTPNSARLYEFLKAQNQKATHFFIGNNIRAQQGLFMEAFNLGDDIAVHTYSHRWMTSLSNADIVAELGWTMQIIHDLTGGRVARYWRPPFGDSDNRVRSIARNIFGLTQVDWNQDTGDWQLGNGRTTPAEIAALLDRFINLPKSPGLIILEHELYPGNVEAFINAYPNMKAKGWDTRSIPDLFGAPYYQNARDNFGAVTPSDILTGPISGPASSIPIANSTSSAPSSTSSTSQSTVLSGAPGKQVPDVSSTTSSSSSAAPSPTTSQTGASFMISPSHAFSAFASSMIAFWIAL